jgi:hypothetical protein
MQQVRQARRPWIVDRTRVWPSHRVQKDVPVKHRLAPASQQDEQTCLTYWVDCLRVLVESVCAGKEKTSQTLHTTGPMLASRCGTRARATPPGPRSLMLFAQDDVPGSRPTGAIHRSSPVRRTYSVPNIIISPKRGDAVPPKVSC